MIYFVQGSGFLLGDKATSYIPEGAVEVSEEECEALKQAQRKGRTLKVLAGKVVVEEAAALESVMSPEDQLAALDAKLPRCVEDTWGATVGFDIRLLPQETRDVYQRKLHLRVRLKREAADR